MIVLSTNTNAIPLGAYIKVEEANKAVIFLRQQSQQTMKINGKLAAIYYRYPDSKEYQPIMETMNGTGFIIKYNGYDYLVTAKHIAKDFSPTGEVVINIQGNKSISYTFKDITDHIKGAHWFHHPQADISLHPFAFPAQIDASSLDTELFPNKEIDIELLSPAVIVGFPLGLGVLDKLSPIAKEAKIASKLTSIDNPEIPMNLHFYFLDQALSQGYSGAPVFCLDAKGKAFLLGVQSSAIQDKTGGKISLVVPSSYIWDILQSPEFQSYENITQRK